MLVKFGSLVDIVSKKKPAEASKMDNYVSTNNMLSNFGGIRKATNIPSSGNVTIYNSNDILFSNIRTYFRKVWKADRSGTCSNDVLVFRPKNTKKLSSDFLFQVCRWSKFTELTIQTSRGTKMPRGDKEAMKLFQFYLPSIKKQQKISIVLGELDDKINLNQHMNKTLETVTRSLFKDWFVDFGPTYAKMEGREPYLEEKIWNLFPDKLDDEGKPEGWNNRSLDEIANFLNGLALQKYPAKDIAESLPVIKIAELRNGVTSRSNRATRDVPEKYIIKDGDFLFSWSASLLAKFWTDGEGALNQHLFKVTSEMYPKWFFSEWVHHHLKQFQLIAASKTTTMGHIQRKHLTEAKAVCPEKDCLDALGDIISPLVERSIKNNIENRVLAQTRDILLPKLVSGELRIPDAEKLLEGTGI